MTCKRPVITHQSSLLPRPRLLTPPACPGRRCCRRCWCSDGTTAERSIKLPRCSSGSEARATSVITTLQHYSCKHCASGVTSISHPHFLREIAISVLQSEESGIVGKALGGQESAQSERHARLQICFVHDLTGPRQNLLQKMALRSLDSRRSRSLEGMTRSRASSTAPAMGHCTSSWREAVQAFKVCVPLLCRVPGPRGNCRVVSFAAIFSLYLSRCPLDPFLGLLMLLRNL
jgi:hypothetical protein